MHTHTYIYIYIYIYTCTYIHGYNTSCRRLPVPLVFGIFFPHFYSSLCIIHIVLFFKSISDNSAPLHSLLSTPSLPPPLSPYLTRFAQSLSLVLAKPDNMAYTFDMTCTFVIFHKRATKYRSLLQKMTDKDRDPMSLRHPVLYIYVCVHVYSMYNVFSCIVSSRDTCICRVGSYVLVSDECMCTSRAECSYAQVSSTVCLQRAAPYTSMGTCTNTSWFECSHVHF